MYLRDFFFKNFILAPPIGVIRFSIWSAVGLLSKSVGSNKQDPYVRIKSGRQIRAKTEIIDNTECPEWGEYHYVPVHSMNEDLVLEVMDWSSGSKDKSLGSTMLHMKDVILQKKDGDTVWYEPAVKQFNQSAPLSSGTIQKGELSYSVEFYPTMALAEKDDDESDTEDTAKKTYPLPLHDLHNEPIRYTPDDLIDLSSYSTGVLTVKIHEVKASQVYDCYCQLMVDSLTAQHKTNNLKGRLLAINETSDAFIKDAGFSRVAIEIKPVNKTDKDDERLGYWYESSERIIRNIQKRARQSGKTDGNDMLVHAEDDEGEWYDVINPVGGSAEIRLSFGYVPLLNYKVNPDESLESKLIVKRKHTK